MERGYKVVWISALCFQLVMPKMPSIFDFNSDVLLTIADTLGEGISVTNVLGKTLREGFKIHAAVTGNNPFAKLNGALDDNFSQSVKNTYAQHTQEDAYVRVSTDLCEQEKNFLEKRLSRAYNAFQALCSEYGISTDNLTSSNMPRVAICASGGGCRAMLVTAAFYDALEGIVNTSEENFLDVVLYAAALSGSTWATVMRSFGLSSNRCFNAYQKYLQFTPDVLNKQTKKNHARLALPTPDKEMKLSSDNKDLVVSNQVSVGSKLTLSECLNFANHLDPAKAYLLPRSQPDPDNNLYNEMSYIQQNIMRKFYGNQDINAMTPYGAFLSHILAAPFDDPNLNKMDDPKGPNRGYPQPRQRIFFSQAAEYLEENNCGNFPLPLCSAVAPRKQDNFIRKTLGFFTKQEAQEAFVWFEFSPYEVGAVYDRGLHGAFVPTWGFGRDYYKVPHYKIIEKRGVEYIEYDGITQRGRSVGATARSRVLIPHSAIEHIKERNGYVLSSNKNGENSPVASFSYVSEYPVGDFLATFGSAFAVSPADIVRIMGIAAPTGNYPYFTQVMKAMGQAFQFIPVGSRVSQSYNNFRLFPFTTSNFLQVVEGAPCKDKNVVLVDAGLAYNIPFPLVLRPQRKVDVIIALDASAPVYTIDKNGNKKVDALVGAQEWAARNNIPFPQVVNSSEYRKIITAGDDGRSPSNIFIFEGTGQTPTIIYIPFLDNPANKDSGFSVSQCMSGECNTFNFGYKPETIKKIRKHMHNTIHQGDTVNRMLQAIANKIGARE